MIAFGNWCVDSGRMTSNPFARIPKANEKADPKRKRRALTEDELNRLILVTRWRPLAEYGRKSEKTKGRTNRKKVSLTFEGLSDAVAMARIALAKNPDLIDELDRQGQERALIVKTLVLTGLRKGELASITVGQVNLTGSLPCVYLNAADEKNRQGSTIPLRADLAADLSAWLASGEDTSRKLFTVPSGFMRILDRDLRTAGIPKRDDRGRTVDVHALRHTFGTLLSAGGVAPRTAQGAMRHSSIDLTMNTYTDPKLLDIQGAVDRLPVLALPGFLVPNLVPASVQTGATQSFPVIAAQNSDPTGMGDETPSNPIKTTASQGLRAGEEECTWQNSNLRPHPCQGCAPESQVPTGQELRLSRSAVAPPVAPVRRKTHLPQGQTPGAGSPASDGFGAALMMIAGLPLSDADKAEAVKRLLRGL